jgi:glutamate/tyrosine decarboxylase-like PLP-dependent enzyme
MGLLHRTAQIAEEHLAALPERRVAASLGYEDLLAALDRPLPETGEDADAVLDAIAALEPGTMATAGPRYFGFVTGGALPVTVAADWLVSTWDGPHFGRVVSPAGAAVEDVTARWVLDALGLPSSARVGFVTGATVANLVGLAAARHRVLADAGWDVEEHGLTGAPPVRIFAGEEAHVSLLKALRILGFGSAGVLRMPVDANGAMQPGPLSAALRGADGPAIVCAQAGNVNTGACDPMLPIVAAAQEAGAWVHVDGAFGLWAAASPRLRSLLAGVDGADSWAVDAHKWLNVPYDCGLAIVADAEAHAAAMSASADYLLQSDADGGLTRTPEMSRRGRQIPVYAALRNLGRGGVAELVERCCDHARRLAAAVERLPGAAVLNEVVLNQVLLRFDDDDAVTAEVVEELQRSGEAWLGGTRWHGLGAARVSFSNWSTSDEDVDRLATALEQALGAARRSRAGVR